MIRVVAAVAGVGYHAVWAMRWFPLYILLIAHSAIADNRTSRRYHAMRTDVSPWADGRFDEESWRAAVPDARFTQNSPNEGRAPSQRTELRVIFDSSALYIAVRCWDSEPTRIVAQMTRRDRETNSDQVTIDISSKNDRQTGYHFGINAAGVLSDGVRSNDTDYSSDWDGIWQGVARRDERGWVALFAIPLTTLRFSGHNTEFGFQVRRTIQRTQEIDEWALVPRDADGEVSYYGTLEGLTGIRSRRLVQLSPYLVGRVATVFNQAPLDGTYPSISVGGDAKIGLTSALTLDLTVNPDFGQVEADQTVLNLSTFEVYYPEKRPFFLEGAEMFVTPIQRFYSRRIGHAPSPPADYDVVALPPSQTRIWGAMKVSGLLTPRLAIGALDALTSSEEFIVDMAGRPSRLTTEPLTNYGVFRLRRDIFSKSYVGILATTVTRFERPFAAAPQVGDTCPDGSTPTTDGRCYHDAYTFGIDSALWTADSTWGLMTDATIAAIVGGPIRNIPDGTRIGPGSSGFGLSAEGGKLGGRFIVSALYQGFSPTYDIDDAGYNRQANLHVFKPRVGYRRFRRLGPFNQLEAYGGTSFRASWDGSAIYRRAVYVELFGQFRNFSQAYARVDYDLNHDDNRETRDGAITERAANWTVTLQVRSDPRRRLLVEVDGFMTRVRHGQSFDGNLIFSIRPSTALQIDLIPHATWTFGDPRWFATVDHDNGTRTYYFAELESRSFDVTARATYAFTPNLTLQGYAQLFTSGGHYGLTTAADVPADHPVLRLSAFHAAAMPANPATDFRTGAINVNLVLRYEIVPGSTIMLVWTHGQQQSPYQSSEGIGQPSFTQFQHGPAIDVVLAKLVMTLMR